VISGITPLPAAAHPAQSPAENLETAIYDILKQFQDADGNITIENIRKQYLNIYNAKLSKVQVTEAVDRLVACGGLVREGDKVSLI